MRPVTWIVASVLQTLPIVDEIIVIARRRLVASDAKH
jgi:hypothetical protein